MKRVVVILVALIIALSTLSPVVAFAEPEITTIFELSNTDQHDDRQMVTVRGEVVGDILNAEAGYKWLLLHDIDATISIFVSEEDALKVTHLGRYNQVGAQLEITGEFHVDCDEHDGLTDIHAISVKVLDEGHIVVSPFDDNKIKLGAVLIALGAGLVFLHWRLRERTR